MKVRSWLRQLRNYGGNVFHSTLVLKTVLLSRTRIYDNKSFSIPIRIEVVTMFTPKEDHILLLWASVQLCFV